MKRKDTGKYLVPEDEANFEVLPNRLGLTTKKEIDWVEFKGFLDAQNYFIDAVNEKTVFNLKFLYSIHKRALGHVYTFAGKLRTVNMSKGGFVFPASRFLPEAMSEFEKDILLKLSQPYKQKDEFIRDLAISHAELLYIHPFREGNGRTARLFANLIAFKHYNQEIDFPMILKQKSLEYIKAVQQATSKEYSLMEQLIKEAFKP